VDRTQWKDDFIAWLEEFPWQWFCSLTFRPGLSEAQARWRLLRWADELRDALGTREFEWIAIPESGSAKLNFHYHALIAGLRESCGAVERLHYMRRWHRRAGDAHIVDYKPDIGGVRYVMKSIGPEDTREQRERPDSKSASHRLFYLLTVGVPAASEWFPSPCVLPAACAQSLDYHTASRKLSKQFHHSLRRFTVSRNDDSPFQILPKFF
jgi:hypothetical protein